MSPLGPTRGIINYHEAIRLAKQMVQHGISGGKTRLLQAMSAQYELEVATGATHAAISLALEMIDNGFSLEGAEKFEAAYRPLFDTAWQEALASKNFNPVISLAKRYGDQAGLEQAYKAQFAIQTGQEPTEPTPTPTPTPTPAPTPAPTYQALVFSTPAEIEALMRKSTQITSPMPEILAAPVATGPTPTRSAATIASSLSALLADPESVEGRLETMLSALTETRSAIKEANNLAEIKAAIKEHLETPCRDFLARLHQEMFEREANPRQLKIVTKHTIKVLTANLLLEKPSSFIIKERQETIASLSLAKITGIKRLQATIPAEVRDLLALFHDIGKMRAFVMHSFYSADLIDQHDLLTKTNHIPSELLAVVRLVIKYHILLGVLTIGASSLNIVAMTFEDEQMRTEFQDEKGGVNLNKLKLFLDLLTYLNFIDAAPRPRRIGLRNLVIEIPNNWKDRIFTIAAKKQGSYDSFLASLKEEAPKYFSERLALKLAVEDVGCDQNYIGMRKYEELVSAGYRQAQQQRVLDGNDWNFLEQNLQYIIDESYSLVFNLARVMDGQVLNEMPKAMNPNTFKLYLKALQAAPRNTEFSIDFVDSQGSSITDYALIPKAAIELDRCLSSESGLAFNVTKNNGLTVVQVQLTNFVEGSE